jgi:hypothetical protein
MSHFLSGFPVVVLWALPSTEPCLLASHPVCQISFLEFLCLQVYQLHCTAKCEDLQYICTLDFKKHYKLHVFLEIRTGMSCSSCVSARDLQCVRAPAWHALSWGGTLGSLAGFKQMRFRHSQWQSLRLWLQVGREEAIGQAWDYWKRLRPTWRLVLASPDCQCETVWVWAAFKLSADPDSEPEKIPRGFRVRCDYQLRRRTWEFPD